jgi:hypothetical protein
VVISGPFRLCFYPQPIVPTNNVNAKNHAIGFFKVNPSEMS